MDKIEIENPVKIPCYNCGKLVDIWLPYYGCVFCEDCGATKAITYTMDGWG